MLDVTHMELPNVHTNTYRDTHKHAHTKTTNTHNTHTYRDTHKHAHTKPKNTHTKKVKKII